MSTKGAKFVLWKKKNSQCQIFVKMKFASNEMAVQLQLTVNEQRLSQAY
jgi:hypothetical protein